MGVHENADVMWEYDVACFLVSQEPRALKTLSLVKAAMAEGADKTTTAVAGTTTTTSVLPSASEATNEGVSTVVLPLRMIICLNEDFFAEASSHSVRAVCTCASLSIISQARSIKNNRAS